MTEVTVKHPAKFTNSILIVLNGVMELEADRNEGRLSVLDPMAGVGRIHDLDETFVYETQGVELEEEWAELHPRTRHGDVLDLPDEWCESFDAVVTSPPYGNRMADHHNAQDGSKRMTYKHLLGRDLTEGSGAGMQWGRDYRDWVREVVPSMGYMIKSGGIMVLNISNHIRKGKEMLVAEYWLEEMLHYGLKFERAIPVPTPRMGFGENGGLRVDHEWVFVTRMAS